MLRTFQRHKNTILGTSMVLILSLSMLSFGVNYFNDGQRNYAIRINDTEISFDEYYRERRLIEERYRSMFGENYSSLAESLGLQISQLTADQLITEALLGQLANRFNLTVSQQQIANTVRSYFGDERFSRELYRDFLGRMRLSARAFENKIRINLIQQQLAALLFDTVSPANLEVLSLIKRDLTNRNVVYATFSPSVFAADVKPPSEEQIQELYSRWSGDFQSPDQISYDYVILHQDVFPSLVEVTSEEIEIYYSENLDKFKSPDLVTLDLLQLPLDQSAKREGGMAALRKTAETVLSELKGGLPFTEVFKKYHKPSEARDGKSGRISKASREELPDEIREAVFSAKEPFDYFSIEATDRVYILKVDSLHPGSTKKLEEVRPEIEKALVDQIAPSFLAAKAQELLQQWEKSNRSLQDLAMELKLPLASTGLLSAGQSPKEDPELSSLTDKILAMPEVPKRVVELRKTSVLAEVKEYREPELKPLSQVKESIVSRYIAEESERLAREAANNLMQQLQNAPEKLPEFANLAKEAKATINEESNISRKTPGKSLLAAPDFISEILALSDRSTPPRSVISQNGNFYLLHVVSSTAPSPAEVEENLATYLDRTSSETSQTLLASIISREKALADKDIDATILAQD